MKTKVICAAAVCATALCVQAENRIPSASDEMPILGWCGIPSGEASVERYREARDAGLNSLMQWVPDVKEAKRVLDCAAAAGIKLLLCSGKLDTDTEAFVAAVKDHPGLGYYHLRDEPNVKDFAALGKLASRIASADPKHPVYLNWFGRVHWVNKNDCPLHWYGVDTFEEYTERSLREIPVKFLSFDQYPVLNPGLFPGDSFRHPTGALHLQTNWYHSLEWVSSLSRKHEKPFWAFALSEALRHQPGNDYPIAQVGHIRLQQYSNLAYGAQGLQYYTYRSSPAKKDRNLTQGSPLTSSGRRSPVFDRMRFVNNEIRARMFVFNGAKATDVWHTGETIPIGTKRLAPKNLPPFVKSLDTPDGGAIVSRLVNGGKEYLMVVNRSPDKELTLKITFAPGVKRVRTDGTIVDADLYGGEYWLDPGAAEIFSAR